jgi:hypothetical protein
MATAEKQVRAATSLDSATQVADARLEARVYRDNGGRYACEIVDGRGGSLTRSAGLVARDALERGAARCARHGAGSAGVAFDVPGQRAAA